jgi:hypothetical protein
MAIQNKCQMRHNPYTKYMYKNTDYPSPTHIRLNVKSLSCNNTEENNNNHIFLKKIKRTQRRFFVYKKN